MRFITEAKMRVLVAAALSAALTASCGGGGGGEGDAADTGADIPGDGDAGEGVEAEGDGLPDTPEVTDLPVDDGEEWIDPPTTTVEPAGTDEIILNPERGFYRALNIVEERDYAWVREEGFTLAHSYIRLDDYRERDLDAAILDAAAAGFAGVRAGGIKIILRFAYNFGPTPDPEPDASKAWILRHIEQLTPLLQDNADVIAMMQAGFIGAWGEWHSSTNGLLDNPQDKFDILDAILAALPADRSVLVRTPMVKEEGYGGPLTEAEAYDGSALARIGHHNDCFLASDTDWGTYPGDAIAEWKDYVARDTLYLPMQGETCNVNPPRSDCPSATEEMALLHWSSVNNDYHPDVVAGWEAQGCRPEMERRLGYRLVAAAVTYAPRVPPGGVLPLAVTIRNEGWAAPFNPRPVIVVLGGASRHEALLDGIDPRWWMAGEETEVSLRLQLPASIEPGTYELALWLPDASASLRDDPRYAIRLANEGTWDDSSGLNVLVQIEVDPSAPGSVNPEASEFAVIP
jgi:hypothetical protein